MSKFCNVDKMYGKDLNVTVTNAPTNIIKKYSKQFIRNALLISSYNASTNKDEYEDDGYPSLFAMDYEGNALQLTYAIGQGNGLYVGDDDRLKMNIDNLTIQEKNSQLFVDTNSLNKCQIDEYGIVQVQKEIEKDEPDFPKSTYIAVNNFGTLYLANDFYNYMWKYVQEEIIKAIQPLIPKNYFGYLITCNWYNNANEIHKLNIGEYIYEANTTTILSDGIVYGFGFYYTSGENIGTEIKLNIDNSIKITWNSSKMNILLYSNYYNVITYAHQVLNDNINDDNNAAFQLIFPPNFYRSGNNFVNKEYRLETIINGESINSEWNTRRLYFNFLQKAGNYIVEYYPTPVPITSIDKGNDITFEFNLYNFPSSDLADIIKNSIQYNVTLIWDKNGEKIELWEDSNCNLNIGNSKLEVKWNTKEKEILREKLNPTPGDDGANSASYKINNLYKTKQYTLRISVLNRFNESEISYWDTDFNVQYDTNIVTGESDGRMRNIYLSEVCIGNDDSYVVTPVSDESASSGNINLDWIYSNSSSGNGGLRSIKNSASFYHEEKVDRINSLFTRKDTDLMTLLFEFRYDDDDINELPEEIYSEVFEEEAFTVKLELLKYNDSVLTTINNDGDLDYTKSNKHANDKIIINIYDDENELSRNKNIEITFKKLIRPSLFINCIKQTELGGQFYNNVYMKVIISNHYLNTQEFLININIDSLVMNTIPYKFDSTNAKFNDTYYINTGIMRLYQPILNISNSIAFDNYSINFTECSDVEVSNYNYTLQFNNILDHNTEENKYKILFTINSLNSQNTVVYKKYIYFQSNELEAEIPGFINNNRQYHYIYLSILNNIYNNVNNYDALNLYDNKNLILKKSSENNWVNNTSNGDFSGYLSLNNSFDIDNNMLTFIDNSNILWYYTLKNKYIINSNNKPLLTIEYEIETDDNGDINIYNNGDIINGDRVNDIFYHQLNYHNHYIPIISNDDLDRVRVQDYLYTAIINSFYNDNQNDVIRIINICDGMSVSGDSYSTNNGASPQEQIANDVYYQEKLIFDLNINFIVKPSEELQRWLYDAYYNNEWYGINYSSEEGTQVYLKTLIKNVLKDLLEPLLNSYGTDNLTINPSIDELMNNINITINDSTNKIDFTATFTDSKSCGVNGGDIRIYTEKNSTSKKTIHYGFDENGILKWDKSTNELKIYGCDNSQNNDILTNIGDNIFVSTIKNIPTNLYSKIKINNKSLDDYLYYFDYSSLYENSIKDPWMWTWSNDYYIYKYSLQQFIDYSGNTLPTPYVSFYPGDDQSGILYSSTNENIIDISSTTGAIQMNGQPGTGNKNTILTASKQETATHLPRKAQTTVIFWDDTNAENADIRNLKVLSLKYKGMIYEGGPSDQNPKSIPVNSKESIDLTIINPFSFIISENSNCSINGNQVTVDFTNNNSNEQAFSINIEIPTSTGDNGSDDGSDDTGGQGQNNGQGSQQTTTTETKYFKLIKYKIAESNYGNFDNSNTITDNHYIDNNGTVHGSNQNINP